jgi:hypothetical protein
MRYISLEDASTPSSGISYLSGHSRNDNFTTSEDAGHYHVPNNEASGVWSRYDKLAGDIQFCSIDM